MDIILLLLRVTPENEIDFTELNVAIKKIVKVKENFVVVMQQVSEQYIKVERKWSSFSEYSEN